MPSLEQRPGIRAGRAERGCRVRLYFNPPEQDGRYASGRLSARRLVSLTQATGLSPEQDGRYASGRLSARRLVSTGPVRLPPFLSCTVVPLRGFSLSIILSPIIPFSGLYLGTHCRGACEADLNWRPANLACRPLNLAHLVE